MENLSIDSIWKKCLLGDRKAQFDLYQFFSKKMYAVCLRYAKDSLEAEDILQIGFVKVFSKAHLFSENGSLEGWIRKIMVNTAIETQRKNKISFVEPLESDGILEITNTTHSDPLHYKDLMSLVHQLPVGYRTVFNLYAIEGYAHKEISEMLNISEGNSKSQLSRARQWLKTRLLKIEALTL
ncbi:RNA polymerase sigma factor [Sphingobacterium sp. SG20118]|uniref:RNA polymerase sigma factor n=1 Tax=Sphingobacterium sp. SG20118 TaxID=3367156 RepID=UPI0037DFC8F7